MYAEVSCIVGVIRRRPDNEKPLCAAGDRLLGKRGATADLRAARSEGPPCPRVRAADRYLPPS